ncbi:MAG TPA: 30S ribosomal protein S3, partial [Candidatus Nanoarchaeia archaeon]|nr:30S ribosomal protein S3 [Candidatus Nanoarchaeia archaeon]
KSDILLREFLDKRFRGMYVSSVEIERGQKTLRIIIETSRPGLIIGRAGEGSVKLQSDLAKNAVKLGIAPKQEIKIDIKEVRYPETNAMIMAQMIAEGLEKRLPFRRVMKQSLEKIMANKGVLGCKIELSGRLGGAEMSRVEKLRKGRVPLQTLRADVDFVRYEARMTYGQIGIKVWIYKGDIFEKDRKNA